MLCNSYLYFAQFNPFVITKLNLLFVENKKNDRKRTIMLLFSMLPFLNVTLSAYYVP